MPADPIVILTVTITQRWAGEIIPERAALCVNRDLRDAPVLS
jgi:hypothetical protein